MVLIIVGAGILLLALLLSQQREPAEPNLTQAGLSLAAIIKGF